MFQHKFPGRLFLTNFHVVDNAKDKKVRISGLDGARQAHGARRARRALPGRGRDLRLPRGHPDQYSGDVAAALERIETLPLVPGPSKVRARKSTPSATWVWSCTVSEPSRAAGRGE